jgi:peptide/nickel transport system ATP-binding protein
VKGRSGTSEAPAPAAGPGPGETRPSRPFLDVRGLKVSFPTPDGVVRAVNDVSFVLGRGQTLGIVGESGSGKSVTGRSILGLNNEKSSQTSGEIWLDGEELLGLNKARVRALRGSTMTMIFQDPLSALNPYYSVGWQISEAYRAKRDASRKQAWDRAVEMLNRVGIPQPERRAHDYPHQFSGGMRQRAMIAMAICCDPQLLVADEPTTALDVTVQANILDLITGLQEEYGTAVIFITHDLGIVADIADAILVMYAGHVVERAATATLFESPQHPYTWGLLKSVTRLDRPRQERLTGIPGSPPSLIDAPGGCPFEPRCPYAQRTAGECVRVRPELRELAAGHWTACHLEEPVRSDIYEQEVSPWR